MPQHCGRDIDALSFPQGTLMRPSTTAFLRVAQIHGRDVEGLPSPQGTRCCGRWQSRFQTPGSCCPGRLSWRRPSLSPRSARAWRARRRRCCQRPSGNPAGHAGLPRSTSRGQVWVPRLRDPEKATARTACGYAESTDCMHRHSQAVQPERFHKDLESANGNHMVSSLVTLAS